MAIHTGVDPRRLAELADDVRQLTEPIHIAHRGRIITHPALLDQLLAACEPGAARKGPQRHAQPGSRPPATSDPLDALATITLELSAWRARCGIPKQPLALVEHGCRHASCRAAFNRRLPRVLGPTCVTASHTVTHIDAIAAHKIVLRALVGIAPTLAPSVAGWLATEVHDWWRLALVHSGWSTTECLKAR